MNGIVGEYHLGHVVHLVGKDFISVEVTSNETSVGVRSIDALVNADIWKLTEEFVDSVVLSVGDVKMVTSVFIRGIFTEHSLVEEEGVVVGVSPSGGFKEDTNVKVGHFFISHVHD